MGNPYKGIANIAKSNAEAQKTLHYMLSKHQSGCIQYKDIGINRLFLGQDISEINQFVSDILGPLQRAPDHNSQLEQTLQVYMAEGKIAINAAAVLDIHINTLYQRLKKIQQVLNIRFDNYEDMLKIQMAFHLKETFINSQ
ncbi:Carbohydrate diacid regulator [compost metagenome]